LCCSEFVDSQKWTRRYQRNNKSSGLKNLRCFPFCSDTHHVRGFCGRSVSLKFTKANFDSKQKIFAWAEFRTVEEPENVDVINKRNTAVKIGKLLTSEQVKSWVRTKSDPFRPWYAGEPEGGNEARDNASVVFEFNRTPRGWHYGWVANKHTSDCEHTLRAYVLELQEDLSYKCIYICDSPSFTLFCRRRQRQNVLDLPVQLKKQLEVQKELQQKLTEEFGNANRMPPILLQDMYERKRSNSPVADKNERSDTMEDGRRVKRRLSAARRDEIVWKIIYALLRLDLYNKENYDNEQEDKTEMKVNENLDDSASFAGFLDFFFDDVDHTELESDNKSKVRSEGENIDSQPKTEKTTGPVDNEKPNDTRVEAAEGGSDMQNIGVDLIEELARFLIDEECFTNAIENMFAKADTEGSAYNERKRMLIDAFSEQVEMFLERYGATMKDLERFIPKPRKRTLQRVDASIATQIHGYNTKTGNEIGRKAQIHEDKLAWDNPIGASADVSGAWRHEPESLNTLEMIRAKIGVPWITNKLFKKMEEDFIIFVDSKRTCMEIKYGTKLMSSGTVKYVLDGTDKCFSLAMPLPHTHTDQMRYCAYNHIQGDSIVLVIMYSEYHRTRQRVYLAEDGSLSSILTYEVKERGSPLWNSQGQWTVRAVKQASDDTHPE